LEQVSQADLSDKTNNPEHDDGPEGSGDRDDESPENDNENSQQDTKEHDQADAEETGNTTVGINNYSWE